MAPQWMPQNLQKRLLLYVLQQVSLFSEIDLDNLDVSLGSSSQIKLSDVDIDTDAFKIPGAHLRDGKIRNLLLQLNVNGGVNIDVDGFNITMALASNSSSPSASNMTNSSLIGIPDDRSRFSLAQSTMDLANSIMQDDDDFITPNQSINLERLGDIPTNDIREAQRQSTFDSMINRAVEVALSKMNVKVNNVSVRILMDHATIDLVIGEATFVNRDGTRTIDLSNIAVVGVHPSGDPGLMSENDSSDKESTSTYDDEVKTDSENDDGGDDNDDDSQDSEMMKSSIIEKKHLDESLVYSKEEASTIYMSATSDAFDARKQQQLESSNLIHINRAQLTFEGLSQIEDLKLDIDRVNIAATPLPLTLLHVIESLGILNSHVGDRKYPNMASAGRAQRVLQDSSETTFLHSLRVNHVEINLISALLSNGNFSKPDTLRLVGRNFEFVQNGPGLSYGSLNSLVLYDGEEKVGFFERDESKNDVRFEKNLKEGEFTLLLSKNLELHLERNHLQALIKLSSLSSQISSSLSKLYSSKGSPSQARYTTLVQTSVITISIQASGTSVIELKVAPISYDGNLGSLCVNKISVTNLEDKKRTLLLSIFNSVLKSHTNERQVRTYDNTGHEAVMVTPVTLSIKSIEIGHSLAQLRLLGDALAEFVGGLNFPVAEIHFKTRKRARISSNAVLQSRQAVKLLVELDSLKVSVFDIHPEFGEIEANFVNVSYLLQKDNVSQIHVLSASVLRNFRGELESILDVIYPDDRSAPVLSARTKDFKEINVYLRNVVLDYYTKWLAIFDNGGRYPTDEGGVQPASDASSVESRLDLKFKLVDFGIGLNPGRLPSKAILVTNSGNFDISLSQVVQMKADFRAPMLVLIDDASNILTIEDAKRLRNARNTWSLVSFYNSRGFVTVAKSKTIKLGMSIKQISDGVGAASKSINVDVLSDLLELELCADSSQCLLQLLNDLKQQVLINPESKYRIQREEIDVFGEVEQEAFNANGLLEVQQSSIAGSDQGSNNAPLNIVDSYYDETPLKGGDILDRDLSELNIGDRGLGRNRFYTTETPAPAESNSNNSDSLILFNDSHFGVDLSNSEIQKARKLYPLSLKLEIGKVTISIFDGYDWKYTRRTISKAVKSLEQKVNENQMMINELNRRTPSESPRRTEILSNQVIGETLFDSIHVSLPVDTENSTQLIDKINEDLQNGSDGTIEFGKNNLKKLRLRRSKYHKVLIELDELDVEFNLFNANDPVESDAVDDDGEYDAINETIVNVKDFEITDNVPTSTWNKFATILKEVDRENGTSMLKLKMTTIRPVLSLAATEVIMDVEVLPLRLHVDQDTLDVLIRFGEFKDSRFLLIDKFEDIIYIQKFTINAIRIKLDYKPKKIDYSGLRSGHTTELMNLFILDEAAMVLKRATLYGISGFPRLGQLLNELWMPDIKQTQLSGVLSGLAPVRSIVKIGSGFKDLVVVPVNEYKKDGRVYRSVSKGVQHFTKNTAVELLKLGIKIANGTQTLLENTEEALGGVGPSARLQVDLTQQSMNEAGEFDSDSDEDYDPHGTLNAYSGSSQLIGKSSLRPQPLYRSTYQPTLESIADINQETTRLDSRRIHTRFAEPPILDYDDLEELRLDNDDEIPKTISLYANQPTDVREGLLLAYDSLGRNFLVAKDAIINAGGEISESGSAQETTRALLKATPITLIRPMIGATEAASKALLGLNNQLDPVQRKYTEDKYKQFQKRD